MIFLYDEIILRAWHLELIVLSCNYKRLKDFFLFWPEKHLNDDHPLFFILLRLLFFIAISYYG